MLLDSAQANREPLPNLDRLIEDLVQTLPVFDAQAALARPLHPSPAVLQALGARYLGDDPDDERAAALRDDPRPLASLVTRPRLAILFGCVHLSYFLAAVVYARQDLRPRLMRAGQLDWEAALQWLVLHGVSEHRLWAFLPQSLITELLRASVRVGGTLVSPLQLCVMREVPELPGQLPTPDDPAFAVGFEDWLQAHGTDRFGLFWLRSRSQLHAGASMPDVASAVRDVMLWPPGSAVLPGELTWPPSPEAAESPPMRRRAEPLAYSSFGADFPCLGLHGARLAAALDLPRLPRNAAARLGPGECIELSAPRVRVQLPTAWLPPSVLLLDLEVAAPLRTSLWVQVSLDGRVQDLRPATAYAGGPVKLLIPAAPGSASPLLEIEFAAGAGAAVAFQEAGGVYARLRGLQFWRLRA